MQDQLSVSKRFSNNADMYFKYNGRCTRISRTVLVKKVRKMTFYDYFNWFIQNEKEGKIADVTLDKYYMSGKNIKEIAPTMLLTDLENNRSNMQYLLDGYGENHQYTTVKDFKIHVCASLQYATDDGYIQGYAKTGLIINSVEETWTPEQKAAKKNKIKSFNATQFNKFKSYVDFKLDELLGGKPIYGGKDGSVKKLSMSDQTKLMIISVGIHTGARFGEILGFKFSDVTNAGININKTWNYHRTGGFRNTKNLGSIRNLMIDDTLYNLLIRYNKFKNKNDIPNDSNRPLLNENTRIHDSVINEFLNKVEKKLGLPLLTMHKLRHSYASYLLYQDVPAQIVAKQLGHSSTEMLFRVYGHILEEKERMAEDRIKGLLG